MRACSNPANRCRCAFGRVRERQARRTLQTRRIRSTGGVRGEIPRQSENSRLIPVGTWTLDCRTLGRGAHAAGRLDVLSAWAVRSEVCVCLLLQPLLGWKEKMDILKHIPEYHIMFTILSQ
jgi:hypothetical protein